MYSMTRVKNLWVKELCTVQADLGSNYVVSWYTYSYQKSLLFFLMLLFHSITKKKKKLFHKQKKKKLEATKLKASPKGAK